MISSFFQKVRLPLFIVGVGAALSYLLVLARPEPQALEQKRLGPMVQVQDAKKGSYPIRLKATGVIQAKQEAGISPQVAGKVVWVADNLGHGAMVRQGEELFKIEPQDYEFRVKTAEFEYRLAIEEYEKVRSRARIARQEWELMNKLDSSIADDGEETSPPKKPNPLVLYEPQLATAKARVDASKAALGKAKLDLERTKVKAPFNARILSEQVEPGKYFRVGDVAVNLIGTDKAEVVVSLPISDLKWLLANKKSNELSEAEVILDDGEQQYRYPASFTRLLGDVDPQGRMNRMVVEVEDPYLLADDVASDPKPPLAVGAFVRVFLEAGSLSDVVELPRSAVRENNHVWIVSDDNTLNIRPVEIARLTRDQAYISKGVKEGEKVVLTLLSGAVEGMQLRAVAGNE